MRKPIWDLQKLQAQPQKVQESLEEQLRAGDCVNWNVEGQWKKRARNPWITQEMIGKMDERIKWKNVNNEEGRYNYRILKNELRIATDNAKLEYFYCKCDEIMKVQRTGRYDLMYKKEK
jgi:hypothetical protein